MSLYTYNHNKSLSWVFWVMFYIYPSKTYTQRYSAKEKLKQNANTNTNRFIRYIRGIWIVPNSNETNRLYACALIFISPFFFFFSFINSFGLMYRHGKKNKKKKRNRNVSILWCDFCIIVCVFVCVHDCKWIDKRIYYTNG